MRPAIFVLLLFAASALAGPPPHVAIRNARIVPVSGPVIESGTVVIREGLIDAVGPGIAIPAGAWVIEGEGLTVYPGLIDALSSVGLPQAAPRGSQGNSQGGGQSGGGQTPRSWGPEDRPATTSWQKAADLFKPSEANVKTARSLGFTTAIVFPTSGIVAGQGSVMQLGEGDSGSLVVESSVGQYLTMRPTPSSAGYPSSLMGVIAYLKQLYLDAGHYEAAKKMYAENPRGLQRPAYDRALEGVLASPRILLPADSDVHIKRMIGLAKDLGQPLVIYGGHEAYNAADALKTAGTAVLVNLKWPEVPADRDPDEEDSLDEIVLRAKAPSSAAVLAKAGVRFALYTGGITKKADIDKAVERAIEAGLSRDDLVRALTLAPAEIFGVADRVGSIEKGKIANLVVTKGDLFAKGSTIEHVFIDGVKYEPSTETPQRRPGASQTSAALGGLQ